MDQHERSTLEALPAVNVEVNGQAAALLVKLMGDFSTDKPLAVLTRALGMREVTYIVLRSAPPKVQFDDSPVGTVPMNVPADE